MRILSRHFAEVQRQRDWILFGADKDTFLWRGVVYLMVVYFGSILLAAVLTPLIYQGVQAWAGATEGKLATYLAHHPFSRYFDRVRMFGVILGMIWLMRRTEMWSFRKMGFRAGNRRRETFTLWFLVGITMLVPILLGQVFAGAINYRGEYGFGGILMVILSALLSAVVVSFLEEAIFRGVVFRLFYTAMRPALAVVLASLFFAMVHFKHVPWDRSRPIGFGEGFEVAGLLLASPFHTFNLLYFVCYFMAGVILCLIFLRTRSLTACAGMHAGWVVTRLSYSRLVENAGETPNGFWGGAYVIDGVLPLIILLLVAALLWPYERKKAATVV